MLAYPLKKATMSGCHVILPNICSVYFYKFTTYIALNIVPKAFYICKDNWSREEVCWECSYN